jgi:hypothetical protein
MALLIPPESFDPGVPDNPPWSLSTYGRQSSGALTGAYSAGCGALATSPTVATLPASKQTVIVGFHFKFPAVGGSGQDFMSFEDGSTAHVGLRLNSDGSITAKRGDIRGGGGTSLGSTSAGVVTAGAKLWFEIRVTVDDSAGVLRVRVGGTEVLTLTGVDTRNGGNASLNKIYWAGQAALEVPLLDDVLIMDTAGASFNDWPGEVELHYQAAASAGNHSDFTPTSGANYTNVDEASTPDDDTTKVSSTTSAHRDNYGVAALGISSGSVLAVVPVCRAKGTGQIALTLTSGGADDVGDAQTLAASYKYFYGDQYLVDPQTGAAWSFANVDAAKPGVKVI